MPVPCFRTYLSQARIITKQSFVLNGTTAIIEEIFVELVLQRQTKQKQNYHKIEPWSVA